MPESSRFLSRACFACYVLPLAIGFGVATAQQPKPEEPRPGATAPATSPVAKADAPAAGEPATSAKSTTPPSDPAATSGTSAVPPPAKADEKPAPKPGPKFLNLRYDEDFSYLDAAPDS